MKVYIDGENCRKGLARVLKKEKLIRNERGLSEYPLRELLADVLGVDKFDINYYSSKIKLPNGYTPTQETLEHVNTIKSFTRKWVPMLEAQDIGYIKAGSLKVKKSKKCRNCNHIQEILQEKGVDVRIAVDIFEGINKNAKQTVVIMSSDTDLCPVLHKAREKKVRVIYVCFADATNRAVAAVANETVTISIEKLKHYYNKSK